MSGDEERAPDGSIQALIPDYGHVVSVLRYEGDNPEMEALKDSKSQKVDVLVSNNWLEFSKRLSNTYFPSHCNIGCTVTRLHSYMLLILVNITQLFPILVINFIGRMVY